MTISNSSIAKKSKDYQKKVNLEELNQLKKEAIQKEKIRAQEEAAQQIKAIEQAHKKAIKEQPKLNRIAQKLLKMAHRESKRAAQENNDFCFMVFRMCNPICDLYQRAAPLLVEYGFNLSFYYVTYETSEDHDINPNIVMTIAWDKCKLPNPKKTKTISTSYPKAQYCFWELNGYRVRAPFSATFLDFFRL